MGEYEPGVCNIGPAEIASRRRAGDIGAVVTVVLAGALLLSRAPRWWRLALVLPAAGSASGYLQARARFCAGFGSRGLYNFGPLGHEQHVVDPQARALDRRRSRQIGATAGVIGLAVAAAVTAVPGPRRG